MEIIAETLNKGFYNKIFYDVPRFSTKKEAEKKGAEFGWKRKTILVHFNLCHGWFVGKKEFQPSEIDGILYDQYTIPLLRWEGSNMPTVSILIKMKKQ